MIPAFLVLEIFFLVVAGAALARLARLRGGKGWPWVVFMVAGYLVVGTFVSLAIGRGPDIIISLSFVALLFPAVLLFVGGGRRADEAWQCPDCHLYNDPTTLVCPCGYVPGSGMAREQEA